MVSARDFVGYGQHPPRVEWPGGKRLAVQIVLNYEAGGERTVIAGDEGPETFGEFPSYGVPPKRDMTIESIFEYETRVAIWRMLELYKRHSIKTTFFATAKTLKQTPKPPKPSWLQDMKFAATDIAGLNIIQ